MTPTLQAIKDEMGALEFAFILEGQAAYTYAAALTVLQDPAYAAAIATILPIEAQHQVVLGLALGKDVDAVFPTGAFESSSLGDGTDPLKGSTQPSSRPDTRISRKDDPHEQPGSEQRRDSPPAACRRPDEHRSGAEMARRWRG